jgi:hypothetical protein
MLRCYTPSFAWTRRMGGVEIWVAAKRETLRFVFEGEQQFESVSGARRERH